MAKLALINREEKRRKMVEKFAAKRAALQAIIDDVSRSEEERFEARLKLQALPLHLLAPYAPPMPGVELVRARLGWDGELTLRQPAACLQLGLRGDGRLADL